MEYVLHYRLEDRAQTPGRCRTDHYVARGEVFYAAEGRAIVRSCIAQRAVDDTYRRNARLLNSLAGSKQTA